MSSIKTNTSTPPSHTQDRVLGIFTRPGLTITGIVGLSFFVLFFRWFWHQGEISFKFPEDWGHVFVIPLIGGYMIYQQREKIARTPTTIFWPAFIPFVLGIQAYAYNMFMVRNHMLQGMSLVMTLGALVLWMVGPKVFRYLFLPISYLVLMITVAEQIMLMVTFKLQLIASQGSWLIMNLIGTPFDWFTVDIDGNTLMILTNQGEQLPMNVAEACSGMRMVVAFYALAVAVALMGSTQWWQRIGLILIAGPVAVFMNMIRVTVLGLLMLVNPDLASGDAHTVIGTLLLVPSLLLFLAMAWMLNRLISSDEQPTQGATL
ncbi:MAG: exosortase/archaeosortase family protein [Phycisphaerales bacterium]|nr:exosortase/archaeosortase family protein [Phycisphaerales bacterium]